MSLLDAFIDEEVLAANPNEIFISIRTDGAKGSGSRSDPYDGSTDEKLDSVLSLAPEGATIRLGPGVFQTKGNGGAEPGWEALNGQRICGAGIDTTVLQLVKAAPAASNSGDSIAAITNLLASIEDFAVSDLTIDCNLSRQPRPNGAEGQPALIATGAIGLSQASKVRIQRVRVINWGTYTPLEVPDSKEDFPIYYGVI